MDKKEAVKERMSFDEIWALLEKSAQDSARRNAEIDRRREESDRESARIKAESDRECARIKAESDRESARRKAELDRIREESDRKWARQQEDWTRRHEESLRRQEKLDEQLKKMNEEMGGISNNAGFHAEQFFQDALSKTLTFGGEKYDFMSPNLKRNTENDGGVEIDIVLINGKSVALIEAKNRIHPKFVKKFAEEKIVQFRQFFPEYQNRTIYLGIAGFSFCDQVLIDAKNYGIGIIKQVGEGVEMEMGVGSLKAY